MLVERRDSRRSWEFGLVSRIRRRSQRVERSASAFIRSGLMIQRTGLLMVRGLAFCDLMYLRRAGRSSGLDREKRWMLARGILKM